MVGTMASGYESMRGILRDFDNEGRKGIGQVSPPDEMLLLASERSERARENAGSI